MDERGDEQRATVDCRCGGCAGASEHVHQRGWGGGGKVGNGLSARLSGLVYYRGTRGAKQ